VKITINARGLNMTKPVSGNRKVSLQFMDVKVQIEGKKNLEMKALSIMAALVQDRMRIYELMQEFEEDEHHIRKNKKRAIDSEFMKIYN